MIAKTFVLCLCALSLQSVAAQSIGCCNGISATNNLAWEAATAPLATPCAAGASLAGPWNTAYGAAELVNGYSPAALAASNGGGFIVSSASPIAPTGVSMTSDNAYDGVVAVTGAVPFLSAVALEGALPTAGAGAVTYGCGNGNVAIMSENIGSAGYGIAGPVSYNAGVAGPVYGYNGVSGPISGIAARNYGGCGCGAI